MKIDKYLGNYSTIVEIFNDDLDSFDLKYKNNDGNNSYYLILYLGGKSNSYYYCVEIQFLNKEFNSHKKYEIDRIKQNINLLKHYYDNYEIKYLNKYINEEINNILDKE
jgi:hypothetical protein